LTSARLLPPATAEVMLLQLADEVSTVRVAVTGVLPLTAVFEML
jgi:hypothetical protein